MAPEQAFDLISSRLGRWPDIETHDLVAADQSDRLILAEARVIPDDVVVIGDRFGALALSILTVAPGARI
ncbi:MAG: hypothetical protein ACTMIY_13570, partial [Microbacterium gubbeenense]